MKVAISATNPCHLYDLARALHDQQALSRYYSGYPAWRLRPPTGFPIVSRSARTLATYSLLRLPPALRPPAHALFRWQDMGFDQAVARALEGDTGSMLHAMPGQALATFTAARKRGISTVINHASGPVRQQLAIVAEEYRRAGMAPEAHHPFDAEYFRQEETEYALADWHCVASSVVRNQLVAHGIDEKRIWVVPYGADTDRFHPPASETARDPMQVVYAGQLTLRKGLRIAFSALDEVRENHPARLDLYGPISRDIHSTLSGVAVKPWVRAHGSVSQDALAAIFRKAAVLVLPSWEEAFGLVVVQALNCGLPCIVSNRVGAADLIVHRQNGSVFPAGDSAALAREIAWWLANSGSFRSATFTWETAAQRLVDLTQAAEGACTC